MPTDTDFLFLQYMHVLKSEMISRKTLGKQWHNCYVLMAKSGGRDIGQRTAEMWEILTDTASIKHSTVQRWGAKPLGGHWEADTKGLLGGVLSGTAMTIVKLRVRSGL